MNVVATPLDGLVVIEPDVHRDARGELCELFRRDRYAELGIAGDFVQDNLSCSRRGVLRGLHFQLGRPQGKLVHVTRGEVFDVAVDLRRGSPTFGRWHGVVLSSRDRRQLWIPAGFAHGFFAVSDDVDFVYKQTATYAPANERAIRWNDPELAIAWPTMRDGEPIVSAKDTAAPLLRDAELP